MIKLTKEKANVLVYMATDMLAKGIPFLLIPFYTAYLSPAQFGNIAIYNVVVEIAIIFVVFGANSYYRVEYFKIDDKSQLFKQLFRNITLTFPVAIALISIYILTGINPGNQPWFWLTAAVFIALFQSIILMFLAEFQCQGKALNVGLVNLAAALSIAIITVVLLSLSFDEEARYWGYFLGSFIAMCLAGYLIKRNNHLTATSTSSDIGFSKPALSFGFGVLPHALSWWGRTGMDRLLIAKFVSVYQVGLYSIAAQVSLIVIVFANAANQAFTPKFMELLANQQYKHSFKLCLQVIAAYLLVAGGIALISPLLFAWFIDEQYHQALAFLPLMCVVAFFQATVAILSNFLYFFKRVKTLSSITSLTSLLHVLIAFLIVKDFGIQGIIYSSIATYVLSAAAVLLVILLLLKREINGQS
ncbi:lipopolysaccharide biosynthesis protein [Colwellia sp. MEBiC06753]